jgi:hypothetical protein
VGLPAAYVPLPIGNGEQRLNALPIVQHGGGMLVSDDELNPEWIRDKLLPVLVNIDQVADMSTAAAALGHGDAADRLAQAVIGVVQQERPGAVQQPGPPWQQHPGQFPAEPAPGPRQPSRPDGPRHRMGSTPPNPPQARNE